MRLLELVEKRLVGLIEAACTEAALGPEARIEAGLLAALGWVDENPVEARMAIIDPIRSSGPVAARRDGVVERLAALLRSARPTPSAVSPLIDLLLIGAIVEAVGRRLLADSEGPAVELCPDLLHLVLGSYSE